LLSLALLLLLLLELLVLLNVLLLQLLDLPLLSALSLLLPAIIGGVLLQLLLFLLMLLLDALALLALLLVETIQLLLVFLLQRGIDVSGVGRFHRRRTVRVVASMPGDASPGLFLSFGFSGGRFEPVGLPDSTAAWPLNWPGRSLAATSGRPWFTEAKRVRFDLAACC
jgi:hypothetical protein